MQTLKGMVNTTKMEEIATLNLGIPLNYHTARTYVSL